MSRSLRIKLVFIMLLLIVLLMTVVLVFLVRGVQGFFTDEFDSQMRQMFEESDVLVQELRRVMQGDNAVADMEGVLSVFEGQLGIDGITRNLYILDGRTAAVLRSSSGNPRVNITENITAAMLEDDRAHMGSPGADFMDIAVPITYPGSDMRYIVYIIDNKQMAQSLSADIFTIIRDAVLIGAVISIAISLIISKTLLTPIQGMTKAAEAMADGDFSRKITVESEDEIGILSKTFNDMASQIETMLEELTKAEQLRREFVANVSHELRTPLTSIRTYAETIFDTEEISRETQDEFLRVIINESDRMTKIVQDLLELSRFDSGNSKLHIEEFSIEQSVRGVYTAIALEARKREHVLNLELEWKLPKIKGDRARIEQVLMNIITNALKYTPDGGQIDIYSGSADGSVWVKIEDTGVGIPEEDLPHVFERFYRVDKARSRESGGTGLGLSIAKEIITMHGGDIQVESASGEGTSVTITLPIEGPGDDKRESA